MLPGVRSVIRWYDRRPFVTTWGLMAVAMAVMMVLFGRDAGLTLRQHVTLAVVSVGLALACTWIIFLERAEPTADGER